MDFDIALVLVVLTFVSGIVWLMDKFLWEKERQAKQQAEINSKGKDISAQERDAILADPVIVDYAKSLFPVFFIVLILRSFIFEPFRIPSQFQCCKSKREKHFDLHLQQQNPLETTSPSHSDLWHLWDCNHYQHRHMGKRIVLQDRLTPRERHRDHSI